ncbi:MAG: ABC transporter ATP-binding protein [Acidobacteria bacterium]|nr:MAG: ABC transporter ATP-binding protein [Acidobacteriota bacterium]PYY24231.1 MAG: ABC transporter ATP-binding protein [Acidobacteriota bacterium]
MKSSPNSALLSAYEETQIIASPAIQVESLGHHYGSRVALDDISLEVRQAEIFGLLGPNGSGKTTLFRILTTLMVPSSGRTRIAGFDPVIQPNEVRRRIGVVAQAQSVDVKLTAAENLMHQGHLYGLSGAQLKRRISEMLERVGLPERAKDLVETLSGGMQRRAELAKGLMHRPSVLLLDEPTTGLDPGARRDLWLYLDSLREREGVTILVTTHLMEEAERCNRLAILNQGRLVGLGTPAELKSEIGGDVIQFEAEDPERLAERILHRFGIACSIQENTVRLERVQGHRFAADVMEAFPGEIRSINVSRPTLEDVFVKRTGHRFWTEPSAVADGLSIRNR